MEYKNFAYLYPPRPEKAIPVNLLGFYKAQGWIAQYKKNGTCNVLFVSPKKEITCMNRHNGEHKAWAPTEKSSAPFKKMPGKSWYVFVTEVLNNKAGNSVKDTHYIFDILVADGEYLIGKTWSERQQILSELFLTITTPETYSHYIITENVWLAKTITGKFKSRWEAANEIAVKSPGAYEDEGLVLKNPNAKLVSCDRQTTNSGWQVKCRVQHKNFSF